MMVQYSMESDIKLRIIALEMSLLMAVNSPYSAWRHHYQLKGAMGKVNDKRKPEYSHPMIA